MKFICLGYIDPSVPVTTSETEWHAMMDSCFTYDDQLRANGHFKGGEALQPPNTAMTLRYTNGRVVVTDGPFAETKELIAGFWIFQVASLAECIEWVKRCPNPMPSDSEIEIRQIFEVEDFGDAFSPELREQEERIRAQLSSDN